MPSTNFKTAALVALYSAIEREKEANLGTAVGAGLRTAVNTVGSAGGWAARNALPAAQTAFQGVKNVGSAAMSFGRNVAKGFAGAAKPGAAGVAAAATPGATAAAGAAGAAGSVARRAPATPAMAAAARAQRYAATGVHPKIQAASEAAAARRAAQAAAPRAPFKAPTPLSARPAVATPTPVSKPPVPRPAPVRPAPPSGPWAAG